MALMKRNTVALKEFMGNHVSEALEVAQPEQFFHLKSSDNIADLGTLQTLISVVPRNVLNHG